MSKALEWMGIISGEIINIQVTCDKTIIQLYEEFFAIMRKHGIKQGTKMDDGNIVSNTFIWTMCEKLFYDRLIKGIELIDLLTDIVPDDLKC